MEVEADSFLQQMLGDSYEIIEEIPSPAPQDLQQQTVIQQQQFLHSRYLEPKGVYQHLRPLNPVPSRSLQEISNDLFKLQIDIPIYKNNYDHLHQFQKKGAFIYTTKFPLQNNVHDISHFFAPERTQTTVEKSSPSKKRKREEEDSGEVAEKKNYKNDKIRTNAAKRCGNEKCDQHYPKLEEAMKMKEKFDTKKHQNTCCALCGDSVQYFVGGKWRRSGSVSWYVQKQQKPPKKQKKK